MTILTWPKWYGKLVESGLNYIPYSTTDVYIITEELPTASWTSFLLILPIILLRHRNLCRKKRCMVLPPDLNNCFWCDQRQIESSGIFFFYIHFVFFVLFNNIVFELYKQIFSHFVTVLLQQVDYTNHKQMKPKPCRIVRVNR